MFIHGGGFRGGTKTKPEIVEMANYYASRGWVFASIDYRTVEELGIIQGMTTEQLYTYYSGIAPNEWIENGTTSRVAGSKSASRQLKTPAVFGYVIRKIKGQSGYNLY